MGKYEIYLTETFEKEVEKLSAQDKKLVFDKIKVIENNPRYQSVKVEGKENLFRTRVNDDIRLFWGYRGHRLIVVAHVGHHDVEKRRKVQNY